MTQLLLDSVDSYAEGAQHHRHVVLLKHQPSDRREPVRAGAFVLPWNRRWRQVTETVFMFSRKGTELGDALSGQLTERVVPNAGPLNLESASGPRGPRGATSP